MKLSQIIGVTPEGFVVGTHDLKGNKLEASQYTAKDVDALLAEFAAGKRSKQDHELLGAQILEPIEQVVPYVEMFAPAFLMDATYGDLEDNSVPVEDITAVAWETHEDGEVYFVRAGYSWTRPTFQRYDAGVEVQWDAVKKAGWNFLARQMRRTTEELARKRDAQVRNALIAALIPAYDYLQGGGQLQKATLDTVLRAKAQIGFPIKRILVNPATLMAMANFNWGGSGNTGFFMPPERSQELLDKLHLNDYGGATFILNPHVRAAEIWLGGEPSQIGWRQLRGSMQVRSDIDIKRKVDFHAMYDAEYATYIGNPYTLARIQIW